MFMYMYMVFVLWTRESAGVSVSWCLCAMLWIRPRPSSFLVVEVALRLARLVPLGAGRGLRGSRLDELLEEHVHEHVHGLRLDDERTRRLVRARVEVLVHAVV